MLVVPITAVAAGLTMSRGININQPNDFDASPPEITFFLAAPSALTDGPDIVSVAFSAINAEGGCTGVNFNPNAPDAGVATNGQKWVFVESDTTFIYTCTGSPDYYATDFAEYTVTVTDIVAPDAPTDLTVSAGVGAGDIVIEFDAPTADLTDYYEGDWYCPPDIDYSGGDVEVWDGYSVIGLPVGESCFVRVLAKDAAGNASSYTETGFTP